MANKYLRSTDGSDSDDGSTWALAKATLKNVAEGAAAGDHIFVSSAHAETYSTAANLTITSTGTVASPQWIVSVDDTSGEPPTTLGAGGKLSNTSAYSVLLYGNFYAYGMTFESGGGNNSSSIFMASTAGVHTQVYEGCTFRLLSSGGSATGSISVGSGTSLNNATRVVFKSCQFKFANVGQKLGANSTDAQFFNCSFESGTTAPTYIFYLAEGRLLVDSFDFTNAGTAAAVFIGGARFASHAVLRNCKFASGWTGAMFQAAIQGPGTRAEMYDYQIGTTAYRMWVEDYNGKITQSSTIYRDGGASEGTGGFSWKLESSANTEWPVLYLETPEIIAWNTGTAEATVAVEIAQAEGASSLTDADIWLEVEYLGTADSQFASNANDKLSSVLTSGSAQDTSTGETWTGLTNEVMQKLVVTVTPAIAGFVRAKVRLAKASATVYVDPKLTITAV